MCFHQERIEYRDMKKSEREYQEKMEKEESAKRKKIEKKLAELIQLLFDENTFQSKQR